MFYKPVGFGDPDSDSISFVLVSSHIHVFYKPVGFCHIAVDPNFEPVLVCLNIQVIFMCFINPWLL